MLKYVITCEALRSAEGKCLLVVTVKLSYHNKNSFHVVSKSCYAKSKSDTNQQNAVQLFLQPLNISFFIEQLKMYEFKIFKIISNLEVSIKLTKNKIKTKALHYLSIHQI